MPEVAGKNVAPETPDDVAALYAWADLKGIKYHDFSAARRAFRAHLRERAATARQETEPRGKAVEARAEGFGSVRLLEGVAQGGQRSSSMRLLGPESMLPQRFPRRRNARELGTVAAESAELAPGPELDAGTLSAMGQPHIAEPSVVGAVNGNAVAVAEVAWKCVSDAETEQAKGTGGDAVVASGAREPRTAVPAWIYGDAEPENDLARLSARSASESRSPGLSPVVDTLQYSRERVASRWFALRGVFDPSTPAMEPTQAHAREGGSPVLAVFSLAGGVGKTSLTAAVGRALSAMGEKVLLADVTAHGLLPFYFGSKELRPGVIRKFLPPPGSAEQPIAVVSYEVAAPQGSRREEAFPGELADTREEFDRVIVDLSPAATAKLRALTEMNTAMLVPVTPDMNSVIGLAAMERFFAGLSEDGERAVSPNYLLTQFDPGLPLHLDVREVMRQQLGDRLLPFVIRRSPAVAEALAEGMTVIDYAPDSGVADDYRDLANWVRSFATPAQQAQKYARWSEG